MLKKLKIQINVLKKRLGKDFKKVLLKHGDPDKPGNFEKVLKAWEDEVK